MSPKAQNQRQSQTPSQGKSQISQAPIHPKATQVLGTIQMLVPSSFNKKFGATRADNLVLAMSLCLDGLSDEQISLGIHTVRDKGFCPDPALFRRFCLGQGDFNHSDTIADSYIGKHGALNAIIKWQDNPKTPITVAMKQAFDETYELWQSIYSQNDSIKAELAFKDCYEQIVNQLVAKRVACKPYTPPVAISQKVDDIDNQPIADNDTAINFLKKARMILLKGV